MTNLRNLVMSPKFKGYQKTREFRKQTDAALRARTKAAVAVAGAAAAAPSKRTSFAELTRLCGIQMLADWTNLERKKEEVFAAEDYADEVVGLNQCTVESVTEGEVVLHCAGSQCNIDIELLLAAYSNTNIADLTLTVDGWRGRSYSTFLGLCFANLIFRDCDTRNLDLLHLDSARYVHVHDCPKITTAGYVLLNRRSQLWSVKVSRISDDELSGLCDVPHLDIAHSSVSDYGIMDLNNVKSLTLSCCPFVTSSGMDWLNSCTTLHVNQCSNFSSCPENPALQIVVVDGVRLK